MDDYPITIDSRASLVVILSLSQSVARFDRCHVASVLFFLFGLFFAPLLYCVACRRDEGTGLIPSGGVKKFQSLVSLIRV